MSTYIWIPKKKKKIQAFARLLSVLAITKIQH